MNHDIVYFVKEMPQNEELRYSLRSVEKNFPHNKIWFYGGCPKDLKPDHHVQITQNLPTKWLNVRQSLIAACKNDNITEDFWLSNDDFFVLKPIKDLPPLYDGDLFRHIVEIEGRHGNRPSKYTTNLRLAASELSARKLGVLNYAVHKPMLINRKKALEVIEEFPNCPMFRALYGNYWKIGGEDVPDVKVAGVDREVDPEWDFVSSEDNSFQNGKVGVFIAQMFGEKGKYEE